jgi:predicted GNAT family acetyltransferase
MSLLDSLRAPPPPEIRDNPEADRLEIFVGGERAGHASYRRTEGTISYTHTEIKPEFEGRGLGGRLIRAALDRAREEGLEVLPVCPFVREYIERHPDQLDLVPEGRRAEFGLDS